MVPCYRSPIKLEVTGDGTAATARGGLVLLFEVLASRRILAGLPRCGGSPSQGWSDGQMMLAVLVLNVAGFDRVSDIEHLEADTGLCALVRRFEPKLLGLSRGAVARRFRGGRERWAVARRLVAEGVREAVAASVTIDLDATIIASGKRECLYTYRAAERLVPGERGYQPLVAFCPEIGMAPWLESRDGNVPAALDNRRALEEALLQLPGAVRQVTLRTDGAGYQEDVIRACNDPAFRRAETRRFGTVGLICGATRSEPLMAEVARLADDAWRPAKGPVETPDAGPASDSVALECAELPYVPATTNGLKPRHVIRYVVTRRALPGALGLDEGDLPAADGRPAYRIRAYMTNFPAPDAIRAEKANGLRVLDAAEVVAAAHERCGRGEEVHAVLKSDLAAGTMPSGRFGANAAWLWLAALALNAMALVRRAAYGPEWRWVRMKRIRAIWIHLVARVARHGRRVTLVLGGAGAHLLAARRRIHLAMPPPASAPG